MLLLPICLLWLSVFPVQLWLCCSRKRLVVKLIPVYYVALHLVLSLLLGLSGRWFSAAQDNVPVAVVLLMVGFFLAFGVLIAWLGWGIVHIIQNSRK